MMLAKDVKTMKTITDRLHFRETTVEVLPQAPRDKDFKRNPGSPIWTQAAEVCGGDCVKGAQFSSSLRSEDKRSGYADPLHFL